VFLFIFPVIEVSAQQQLTDPKDALCPSAISEEACEKFVIGLTEALRAKLAGDSEYDVLKKMLKDEEFLAQVLNSPFMSNRFEQLPFNVTFKVIDIEDADSVLALQFDYKKTISRTVYDNQEKREKSYGFEFSLDGTATQNEEENPRNFIDATLSFSFSNNPTFNEAQAVKALTENYHCTLEEFINDVECAKILADGQTEYFEQIRDVFYVDYGLEVSYETEQSFDRNNTVISTFFSATYEDFRRTSFLGSNSIVPSLRFSLDTVEPSADSPRSMAGDDSSYERFSAELHVSVPLINILDIPYLFSYNYRTHMEISPSEDIKNANLESYHLRTYSLSAPSGLVVSYSSGRLPFGLEDQQIIELGFKTYF
jgi:hypothetical protein